MAKIAVEATAIPERPGATPARRRLAEGPGWSVAEVFCGAGPRDRAYEERHGGYAIALVTAGSFQYRSRTGREVMTPGSLLLGNPGQYFECSHEHGVGDRCVAFAYSPEYFAAVASATGQACFTALRVAPARELATLGARACAGARAAGLEMAAWEELGAELAGRALEMAGGGPNRGGAPAAEARVTRALRLIENHPEAELDLGVLAGEARLSRYHFLRLFRQLAGATPHEYLRRARLRRAATRLLAEDAPVLQIALESGFGDVSNFNHAFRAEFGMSPRAFRHDRRA